VVAQKQGFLVRQLCSAIGDRHWLRARLALRLRGQSVLAGTCWLIHALRLEWWLSSSSRGNHRLSFRLLDSVRIVFSNFSVLGTKIVGSNELRIALRVFLYIVEDVLSHILNRFEAAERDPCHRVLIDVVK